MIVRAFRHAETDRDNIQKARRFWINSCLVQIRSGVKNEFVNTRFKLISGQNLRVRSPIIIRGQRFEMRSFVAIQAVKIDDKAGRRAPARRIQNMCRQIAAHSRLLLFSDFVYKQF